MVLVRSNKDKKLNPPAGSLRVPQSLETVRALGHRQSVGGEGNIQRICRSGFNVFLHPSDTSLSALAALLPDPDIPLASGTIFKPGSRTHAGVVALAGSRYFLKRYNCRGLIYSLQNAVRRSRAVRTWWVTWKFFDRGVPVPRPLLCLEERRFRLLGRSYILMDFVGDAEPLVTVWPALETMERCSLLLKLAEILGKMHRAGCLHGDLKWSNILVRQGKGENWDVWIVDLDGSRVVPTPSKGKIQKDIERFLRDLDGVASSQEQTLFRQSWHNFTANP